MAGLSPAGSQHPPPRSAAGMAKLWRKKVESWDSSEVSGPMFAGGLGSGLSEVNRVRLKALEDLEEQYEKLSEYVLAVRRILNYLVEGSPSCDSKKKPPYIDAAIKIVVDLLPSEPHEELRREFQEILEDGRFQAQTPLEQYSIDLCIKLEHSEQHIDGFSVAVVSKCREVTFIELQDLKRRIQMLPEKAMDRVVKIIKHPLSPALEDYEEIRVDLNRESNSAHSPEAPLFFQVD